MTSEGPDEPGRLLAQGRSAAVFVIGGLLVLLLAMILSVYKPKGSHQVRLAQAQEQQGRRGTISTFRL